MVDIRTKKLFYSYLQSFNGKKLDDILPEVRRVLSVAKGFGYYYSERTPYGTRDKEVSIYEGNCWTGDPVGVLYLSYEGVISFTALEEYFQEGYEPKVLPPYNSELDAEARNEEALYGYQVVRPWDHSSQF